MPIHTANSNYRGIAYKSVSQPAGEHVLIIGGGIGGLTLALFLKKAGISCAIYEAFPYKEGIGGGFNIAPNGMNVLNELGLANKITARGQAIRGFSFRRESGRSIARMKIANPAKYGRPGVTISRAALHEILTSEVRVRGIAIHYEKRVVDIHQDIVSVTAYFQDGTTATGDLLIGADGIRSKTRQLVFPGSPKPQYLGLVSVGGFVPLSSLPDKTLPGGEDLNFTFGSRGFIGYGMADSEYAMWWSSLPRDQELSPEELRELSLDKVKQEMLANYKGYHAPIEALIEGTQRPLKVNMEDLPSIPRWYKDRVLLIGDAAHAVSSNSGQGASMALEDAIYLARLLRDADGRYDKAFRQFEEDRRPRVEKIVAEGRKRGAAKKVMKPVQVRIQQIMMSIFITLFGARQLDWVYKYKVSWEEKALSDSPAYA